jgi:hypothetical protein
MEKKNERLSMTLRPPAAVLLTRAKPYGGMSIVMTTPPKRIVTTNLLRARRIVTIALSFR